MKEKTKKLNNIEYFKLLEFCKKELNITIDFKDKNKNQEIFSFFKNDFRKKSYYLYKNNIFNPRKNEEDFLSVLLNMCKVYKLDKEKTKEEIIELIKNEGIDNIFSISFFIMLDNLIVDHISVYIKDYKTGKSYYSNAFKDNVNKIVSLYVTDFKDETGSLDDKEFKAKYRHKFLNISEMKDLEMIRDFSTLRNTLYVYFVSSSPFQKITNKKSFKEDLF